MITSRTIFILCGMISSFVYVIGAMPEFMKELKIPCKIGKRCNDQGSVWHVKSYKPDDIRCQCIKKPKPQGCGKREGKKCKSGHWRTHGQSNQDGSISLNCLCSKE